MDAGEMLAARNLEGLRRLVVARPEAAGTMTAQGLPPLTLALYMRYRDAVDVLLEVVEPDGFQAAILGDAKACLSRIPSPDAMGPDGFTALHLAAHFDHADLVHTLVAAGCPVDIVGGPPLRNQPLHAAAAGGAVDALHALLAEGAPVDGRDGGGNTPLMIATAGRHASATKALLAGGADRKAANRDGHMAHDIAVERGYPDLADLLLQHS